MKKRFTSIIVALLAVLLVGVTALSGCDRGGTGNTGGVDIDTKKTQLYVGAWEGGFQWNWLTAWVERFEEFYKDTEFEDDKKGVQVILDVSKNYALDSVASSLKGFTTAEVAIVEQCNYYSFITNSSALDITDAITTPLTEYGESKSIAQKMSADNRAFYGAVQNGQTKYYGVPWYESFFTINYDVDLFEENNYYFAADGYGSNGFVTTLTTPRSNGPDGKTGVIDGVDYTADDGLPATYDEFFKLCDKIDADGNTPVIWAGSQGDYNNFFTQSLVTDFEGYNQMNLNYTLNGNATNLVDKINADGSVSFKASTPIDGSNGYLLQQQAGRYYAMTFWDRLINTKKADKSTKYYVENDVFGGTLAHTGVQTKFLRSRFGQSSSIAMLIDGSWWYNEATSTWNSMASIPGAGKTERRIGVMPIPKPSSEYLGRACYANNWITDVVVNANIAQSKVKLAKDFVRFIHTDESLSEFTKYANGVRPFDYDLTESDAENSSYYAKQLINLHKTADVVDPWSTHPIMINNMSQFVGLGAFNSIIGSKSYNIPTSAVRQGVSAKSYFEGLSAYWTATRWQNSFGALINNG